MSYVNLHCHSHYSLLDGFGSPKAIIKRAKELGSPAAALTDHGVTYGLIDFYNAARAEGIKPLLGCELYVARRSHLDKEAKVDVKPYHLTIIAKNNIGYANLLTLVSKAHLDGFYYKPRVDYDLLKKHGEGLIALSGCQAGHLPQSILAENEKEIEKVIDLHLDIFGEGNYFLEVQDHPLLETQGIINSRIFELGKEKGIDIVATNDSHYPRAEDTELHDIMLCIQTGTTVNEEERMRYTGDFSIREVEDMEKAFPDNPEVLKNTLKVADMCNVDLSFGDNLIPRFDTPGDKKPDDYLKELCLSGLKMRFGNDDIPEEYIERLDYELKMVHDMGFDTYFLIVWDFVKFAKDQKIIVGPGRGSAAGSIIAWTLDITELDPIKYGLFFERFLNPERVSMPDIDIDFADDRRDEVIDYVVEKYGRDKVAQIVTFGTMGARASIRDVGRALGYPYAEVDAFAKMIPPPVLGKNTPLALSVIEDPELSNEYKKNPRAKVLLDYAKKIEGSVRHVGTHACAVVISEKPLTNYTALQYGASGGEEIVTQFSAGPLEALGLLKMDFLGLRNLTVIDRTLKILKRTQKIEFEIGSISLEDNKTFELLQRADTTGVFQLESGGMRRYLKELKPTIFEDIVAMGALYRPGPMEWIPTYIEGKHHPDKVKYLDESFKEVLSSTYGVAVYQEQILQLSRDFAGFTLGEADILRKAVGKKIASLLEEQRDKFISGAVKNGHERKFAAEVFAKVIEPFAGYGFNKAHAACYGMIAYQTAYLKAHYPIEFMTALLCSDSGNMERVVLEIKECSEMGVEVLPPSVNESFAAFTVVDEKSIRFGLMAVKGIGEGPVKEIIAVRDAGGVFKSLEDFAARVPSKIVNKKLVQALAATGAFDEFGDRNQIFENYDSLSKFSKAAQSTAQDNQSSIFGLMDEDVSDHGGLTLRDVPVSTVMQRLKWEKAFLGLYVSGHPLKGLKRYISRKATMVGSLTSKKLEKTVRCVGLVTGLKRIMTKAGGYMASFILEDPTARVSVIIFPKTYVHCGAAIAEDQLVSLSGRFDNKRGPYQIICDSIKPLSFDVMVENAKEAGTYDPDEKQDVAVRLIDDILEESEVEVDEDAEVFVIDIPKDFAKEPMEKLKKLLLENKGDTPVELNLSGHDKKLKLPFGVDLSDKLKKAVSSVVAG